MTFQDRTGSVIDSTDISIPGSVVRHAISVAVVETDDPITFSCLTDFNDVLDPAPGEDEATNVVDYEYSYSSGEITVHCE